MTNAQRSNMADYKHIFELKQKDLLWLANTEAGRWLLGAQNDDKIVKIFPNGYSVFKDFRKDKAILQATFFNGNIVASDFIPLLNKIKKQEEAERLAYALLDAKYLEQSQVRFRRFLTGNFGATTSNTRFHSRDQATWAAARDATSCSETMNESTTYGVENQTTGGLFYIARSFLSWLTGTVLNGALSIDSATLSIYGAVVSNPNSESIGIANATPADPTSYVQGDFDQLTLNGATEFATRKTFASISTVAYNDFAFNASGLAAINKTAGGYTSHSIRSSYDFDNTSAGANDSYVGWKSANDADPNKRPKFVVVYAAMSGGAFLLNFV